LPSEKNNEILLAKQFSVLRVEESIDGVEMITTTEATNLEEPKISSVEKTVLTAVERETTATAAENLPVSIQSASETQNLSNTKKKKEYPSQLLMNTLTPQLLCKNQATSREVKF
ncbi:hypothetical protein NPIL_73971, partial [Nephila pilipes]